jgi:hypothetical protein
MTIQELGIEEMARIGATHRVVIRADDINGLGTGYGALSPASAAATTATLNPFGALAAGNVVQFVQGYLKTAFDGTTTTALTLGISYDLASGTDKVSGYQTPVSIHNDSTPIPYFPQEIPDATATFGTAEAAGLNSLIKAWRKVFTVANTVQINLAATGANLTDLITGEVHLYFRVIDLSKAA